MIRGAAVGLLVCAVTVPPLFANAAGPTARQKPGPVTVRGTASYVRSDGFILKTRSHGNYAVVVSPATAVIEKGKSGRPAVHEGDHVGVRGFVRGREIRAIQIRVYPTKPKPYSVRATVVQVRGSRLTLLVGRSRETVDLTGQTVIRVGSAPGSVRDLRVGDTVQARLVARGQAIVALHLHIYRRAPAARSVRLQGTIVATSRGQIVLTMAGRRQSVGLSSDTHIYLGSGIAGVTALKPGELVTVYACCEGRPLVATSVHARKPKPPRSVLIRGRLTGMTSHGMRVSTSAGSTTVTVDSSTVYEIGSVRTGHPKLRVGDEISVRGYPENGDVRATRVHIYIAHPRSITVRGVVVSVGRGSLDVEAGGKRYTVSVRNSTSIVLGGQTVGIGATRPGDQIRATGPSSGRSGMVASRISLRRIPVKARTVRVHGSVQSIRGGTMVVTDDAGIKHQIRLGPAARPLLHGKPAPAAALFPGVEASVRGTISGGVLVASRVTLTVRTRTARGRIARLTSLGFSMALSSGDELTVDLTALSPPVARSTLHPSAYVQVRGYVERETLVRAYSLRILHPQINVAGTVLSNSGGMVVQTSKGERLHLRFGSASVISVDRLPVTLRAGEVPVGARVHVRGVAASDGTVTVAELKVRLASETVRGTVVSVAEREIVLNDGTGLVRARLTAATTVMQGSHPMTIADIVVGDDVSVYGSSLGPSTVVARRVLVHRKLRGFDGTVGSVTADGFTLVATGGSHRVIVKSTTIFSSGTNADIAVGKTVHVTGYLRGDGSILATRVRVGKK